MIAGIPGFLVHFFRFFFVETIENRVDAKKNGTSFAGNPISKPGSASGWQILVGNHVAH